MQALGCAVYESPDSLDVRIESTFGPPMGVTEAHPEERFFATHFANGSHEVPRRKWREGDAREGSIEFPTRSETLAGR